SWQLRGSTSYRNYHKNLLKEALDIQRFNTRKLEAELWGAYDPTKVLEYNGDYWFYAGGSYSGVSGEWNVTLMKLDLLTDTDSFEEILDFDTSTKGAAIDSAYYAVTISNRKYNVSQIITKTSEAISGTISSIPIDPTGNEWIDAG